MPLHLLKKMLKRSNPNGRMSSAKNRFGDYKAANIHIFILKKLKKCLKQSKYINTYICTFDSVKNCMLVSGLQFSELECFNGFTIFKTFYKPH